MEDLRVNACNSSLFWVKLRIITFYPLSGACFTLIYVYVVVYVLMVHGEEKQMEDIECYIFHKNGYDLIELEIHVIVIIYHDIEVIFPILCLENVFSQFDFV